MMMPTKKSKSATQGNAAPNADTIAWDDAVDEAKEILARIEAAEQSNMRLGELAAKVETKYKDHTLAKFAKAIGRSACTVARWRDVYRAWNPAPGRELPSASYAVLRELATHPKREELVRENPKMTKMQASKEMRDYRSKDKGNKKDQKPTKNTKKLVQDVKFYSDSLSRTVGLIEECTDEQQQKIGELLGMDELQSLKTTYESAAEIIYRLEQMLDEQAATKSAVDAHEEELAPCAM
jgi:hypothetical protein